MSIVYILCSAFLFSTMEVAMKITSVSMGPIQISFIRFFIGGLLLLPIAISGMKSNGKSCEKKDVVNICVLGILLVCISMMLYQFGVTRVNASMASVVFSSNTVTTSLLAHLLIKEKITKVKIISMAICVVGVVIMSDPLHMAEGNSFVGLVLILASTASFSLYTVLSKKYVVKYGGMMVTSIGFLSGSIVLGIFALLNGEVLFGSINAQNLIPILYISFFITGVGYVCYFFAVEKSGAANASVAFIIKPALASLFAVIVLHDALTVNNYVGIAILVIGSLINLYDSYRLSKSGN